MGIYHYKLPDIGEGVTEAEITAWHVKVGDRVEEDAPVADAMTDKATIELTSPVEGVVKSIACEEGDTLAVGAVLVEFEVEGAGNADSAADPAPATEPGSSSDQDPGSRPETKPVAKAAAASSGLYAYKLPDIGEGVTEAEITAWHVAVGDEVEEDAPIADAMTDKATIELTSPVAGIVRSVACEEGETLAVGAVLAEFETEDGHSNVIAPEAEQDPGSRPGPETNLSPASEPGPQAKTELKVPSKRATSGKVLASPAVRKRAENIGFDLSTINGSGPDGRVLHEDLDGWLMSQIKSAPASEPGTRVAQDPGSSPGTNPAKNDKAEEDGEERVKVIGLRRVISQRMAEAKRNIPHFTYVDEVDVTALEAFRKRANEKKSEEQPKLTVLPLFIKALTKTLEDWPQFNARYYDGEGYVSRFTDVNLGIATQTDLGLIVPVLKRANKRTLFDMADEIARLAEAARTNQLSKDDLEGATTTLTSLGPLGGIVTTPVINRPEVAIFGPNKIRSVVVMDDGVPAERLKMNVSVSCDHRVIDGYDCALMVQELKARLEDPQRMFLE